MLTLLFPMPPSLLRIVVNNPALYIISRDFMVSVEGVEPSILPASGLKPDVYASSTTRPYKRRIEDRAPPLDLFIAR